MEPIFLGIITLAVVAVAIALIVLIFELRTTAKSLRKSLTIVENGLKPTLEEVQETLKGIRNLTYQVTLVSEDAKLVSSSMKEVGENVKQMSGRLAYLTELAGGLTARSLLKISGLQAGVRVAGKALLENLLKRRS